MNETQRTTLRLKQDFLLMLAVDMRKTPESFRVTNHPGAPTLSELRGCVWPVWEASVDQQVRELAAEMNVGVPNFEALAEVLG